MVSHSLPLRPAKANKSRTKVTSTSLKSMRRVSKRVSPNAAAVPHCHRVIRSAGMKGRCKRVWKACDRCQIKKTKCDGELPCLRCKDFGLVCTAGVRKMAEYKQVPGGYAEVLENGQLALIATIHKLYNMVRNSQPWGLGEPGLNGGGLPVIHDIAQKLGSIRPNSDIDLPAHSVFPEDEASMAELARQLEEQHNDGGESRMDIKDIDLSSCQQHSCASASELDHSEFEDDHKATFGSADAMTLSIRGFVGSNYFELNPAVPQIDSSVIFTSEAQSMHNFSTWPMPRAQASGFAMHFLQQAEALANMSMSGLVDSDLGNIKPKILPSPDTDAAMSIADPMISGFDGEVMWP